MYPNQHHSDPNSFTRHHQLQLMHSLVQQASSSNNNHLLHHVYKYASKYLLIRLKDKSSSCRALAMSTLSFLLQLPTADETLKKELKYFTRYDPSVEVRRIGTRAAGGVERLKLRFFYDQAFDRNMNVRVEAFRAMGVMKDGGLLVRDMSQLSGDKLCRLVLWGTLYSDG